MKLLVGQRANLAWFAFPNQRSFVLPPGLQVAVKAVVGKVDVSAGVPLRPGRIPFENLLPLFEPMQILGHAPPELLRLFDGLAVEALVLLEASDMCLLAELRGALEAPL